MGDESKSTDCIVQKAMKYVNRLIILLDKMTWEMLKEEDDMAYKCFQVICISNQRNVSKN